MLSCFRYKSQHKCISQSVLPQTFRNPYLCVAVVRVPAGSEALLPADIPNQEVCFVYSDLLNVASNGGWSLYGLLCQTVNVSKKWTLNIWLYKYVYCICLYDTLTASDLQLVEDGCFSSIVQTHNDDFVLCKKKKKKRKLDLNWTNWICRWVCSNLGLYNTVHCITNVHR